MKWLLLYLVLANAAGCFLFWLDKYKAVRQQWRIPESRLLLAAVLGGGLGCLAGMFLFHHKTRHKKFTIGIPVILLAQAALLTLFLLWHYSTLSYREDPVKLVRHELSVLKNTDSVTVDQELSYEDLFPSEDTDKTISRELQNVFSAFFDDFRYKILDVEKGDGRACVTVRLTTLDGKALAREYSRATLSNQIQNSATPSGVEFSLEDCYLLLASVLENGSFDTVTSEYAIELEEHDGIWSISSPSELQEALTGSFATYVSDPYLLTPSETVEVYLDTLKSFDMEQLTRYFSLDSLFSGDAQYKRSISQALSQQLLDYLDYEISGEELSQDGAAATVSLELTSCDCYAIMEAYQQQVLAYTQTSQALQDGISGRLNKANDILISCITENKESTTSSLDVSLENDGSSWKLNSDDALSEALLGNISEAMNEVSKHLS